jgi:hypothetical protein
MPSLTAPRNAAPPAAFMVRGCIASCGVSVVSMSSVMPLDEASVEPSTLGIGPRAHR